MYDKIYLEKIADETGFVRDTLEKLFRLCDILQYLNTNPVFSEHTALKGGTAINLTVFKLPRLSVDIDLDFTKECTRDEMMQIRDRMSKDLVNYLFTKGYSLNPNTRNPHSLDSWVFHYQNAAGNRDNIKVEINYSLRHHVLPIVLRSMTMDFLQQYGNIRTLDIPELFGSKIKALIERTAPRDLYDINNMLQQNIVDEISLEKVRKIVLFYLAVGGNNSLPARFEFTTIEQISFRKIKTSLVPVLKKGEQFDFENAKRNVKEFLDHLMILDDRDILFIEKFNQGKYHPELLFDDETVCRIKDHPMAIWKIGNISSKLNH